MRRTYVTLFVLILAVNLFAEPICAKDVLSGDKTLVVWVAPSSLTQRGAGPLCMDNLSGEFDAITFGELSAGKWRPLAQEGGAVSFDLGPGGGELLRISGRAGK